MIDLTTPIDVAIIGGGPSGLAAATTLKAAGVTRVVVLERESDAGGIPRHCGHPPFGAREFKRVYTGPSYARKLVQTALAAGVEINCLTTVVQARIGGELLLAVPEGQQVITARRVIYATGVRETPRSARLLGGMRLQGVVNTGALQSMVFLKHMRPFKRPVIVGTELVAISAVSTCAHAGIRPVAMVEPDPRPTVRWPFTLYPRLKGVPLHLNTRPVAIHGDKTVSSLEVQDADGTRRRIGCDGVILSGMFTPESTLGRMGHLEVDPATGGPVVDQFGRCTDPAYFAAGNLLRPVETAGWSWNEGCLTGARVADDLAGKLPEGMETVPVCVEGPELKYVMPQRLNLKTSGGMYTLQLRLNDIAKGHIIATSNGKVVGKWPVNSRKERRILLPISELDQAAITGPVTLTFALE
ncbi:NAD(P)/FAD-dependent oxidoreductase [Profundibacter sp.]|uniref:NAD(P)/FAD-dependent oxidoreductase n=1 Tax=Profundibacter sp. TaxID=3101071 RepID=UPI003D0FC1E4